MSDGTVTYSGANAMSANGGFKDSSQKHGKSSDDKIYARVTYVLRNMDNMDKFKLYNGILGTIECVLFIDGYDSNKYVVARPMNQNKKLDPLINEMVILEKAVGPKSQGSGNNYLFEYYYTGIIATWGGVEHNATPDSILLKGAAQNNNSYSTTLTGNVNKTNNNHNFSITGKFNETGKVPELMSNEGDMILQGRSSHSIKFGSSILGSNSPFNGPDRSPFLAIVNGHAQQANSAIFEDINKDGTSFYALNKHNVSFLPSAFNFDSHNQTVDSNVKSNYVQPAAVVTNDNNVSSTTSDNKKPVIDTTPVKLPVAKQVESKQTTNNESDYIDLPDRETNTQVFQETEDIIKTPEDQEYSDVPEVGKTVSTSVDNNKSYNVKFIPQEAGSTLCFVAATSMIFQYLASTVNPGYGNYTYSNIKVSFLDKSGNLLPIDIANDAKKNGLQLKYERISIKGGKEGLQQIIDELNKIKFPFILERQPYSSKKKSHFVVVTGIDTAGNVLTNDPSSHNVKTNTNKILTISDLKDSGGSIRIFIQK